MSRPRLLLLSFSPIDRDPRVLRQLRLFAGDMHVTTCGFGGAPEGADDHIEVPWSERGWWPRRRLAGALLLARRFHAFYRAEPRVQAALAGIGSRSFDVVIANDVTAVPLALDLAPTRGVHADLHEWEPRTPARTWQWRLYGNPLAQWEIRQVRRAASVTTVAPGIAAEYSRRYGIEAAVVTNATDYHDLAPSPVRRPLRVVHSGGALAYRRLEVLLDAMRLVGGAAHLDLMLVPQEPAYLARLRASAEDLPNVTFRDPVPFRDLVPTMAEYDLGIHVLAPTSFNNAMALPNKLFEYVQARLGVVIGPSPEMAHVVRSHGLGVVAKDFSAEAVAEALLGLSAEDVAGFKERAHEAARDLSAERQVLGWRRAVDAMLG